MKKIICVLLVFVITMSLSACFTNGADVNHGADVNQDVDALQPETLETIANEETEPQLESPISDWPDIDLNDLQIEITSEKLMQQYSSIIDEENYQIYGELIIETNSTDDTNENFTLKKNAVYRYVVNGEQANSSVHGDIELIADIHVVAIDVNGNVLEERLENINPSMEFYLSDNPLGVFTKQLDVDTWQFTPGQVHTSAMQGLMALNPHGYSVMGEAFENEQYFFWVINSSASIDIAGKRGGELTDDSQIVCALSKDLNKVYIYSTNANLNIDAGGTFVDLIGGADTQEHAQRVQILFCIYNFGNVVESDICPPQEIIENAVTVE